MLPLQGKGFRYVEALVITLVATSGICFAAEIIFSKPNVAGILQRYLPNPEIVRNPEMLYIAVGILGATVMPHNLYITFCARTNSRLATYFKEKMGSN